MFLVLIGGIGLCLYTGLVPSAFCGVLAVLMVLMLIVGRRAAPRMALASGIGVWLAVTALFLATSRLADARAAAHAARFSVATLDRVLTPLPVNPLCWELMLVQTAGDRYFLRRAMLSLAPPAPPSATRWSSGSVSRRLADSSRSKARKTSSGMASCPFRVHSSNIYMRAAAKRRCSCISRARLGSRNARAAGSSATCGMTASRSSALRNWNLRRRRRIATLKCRLGRHHAAIYCNNGPLGACRT